MRKMISFHSCVLQFSCTRGCSRTINLQAWIWVFSPKNLVRKLGENNCEVGLFSLGCCLIGFVWGLAADSQVSDENVWDLAAIIVNQWLPVLMIHNINNYRVATAPPWRENNRLNWLKRIPSSQGQWLSLVQTEPYLRKLNIWKWMYCCSL